MTVNGAIPTLNSIDTRRAPQGTHQRCAGVSIPEGGECMSDIHLTYINGKDIARLELTDAEILDAVEQALVAQGNGQTVIEPRVHLIPDPAFNGHFNVLRGYVAPLGLAGVKIVGDF